MATTVEITLPDVKSYLSIDSPLPDEALLATLAAATSAIQHRVGPLTSQTRTKRLRGRSTTLMLPVMARRVELRGAVHTFTVSVDSITARSGAVVTADWEDLDAGLLYGSFGEDYYDVAYTAGWGDPPPPDLVLAVMEQARYLWRPRRGPGGSRQGESDPQAIPRRVDALVAPYELPAGFA